MGNTADQFIVSQRKAAEMAGKSQQYVNQPVRRGKIEDQGAGRVYAPDVIQYVVLSHVGRGMTRTAFEEFRIKEEERVENARFTRAACELIKKLPRKTVEPIIGRVPYARILKYVQEFESDEE